MKDLVARAKAWIDAAKARPWIAHLLRAFARYGDRLGAEFAAAITYFSVLAIVPILMFAFSVLGLTLTVLRPDLLDQIRAAVTASLSSNESLGGQVTSVIEDALANWRTIGVIGLLSTLWAGASWIANLKSAVRAQLRPDRSLKERKSALPIEVGVNIAILIGLLACLLLTLGMSSVATAANSFIWSVLHFDTVPFGAFLLQAVPLVASLLAAYLLFVFVYKVFPEDKIPTRTVLKGAAIGAVGMVALEYLTTLIIGVFTKNAAAALFGPVIVLMLFLNLFAQLVLVVSAWIATADVPPETAIAPDDAPAIEEPADRAIPASPVPADELFAVPGGMVSQSVAQRAMGVGMGTGLATGVATGLGVGAAIVALLKRRPRGR